MCNNPSLEGTVYHPHLLCIVTHTLCPLYRAHCVCKDPFLEGTVYHPHEYVSLHVALCVCEYIVLLKRNESNERTVNVTGMYKVAANFQTDSK